MLNKIEYLKIPKTEISFFVIYPLFSLALTSASRKAGENTDIKEGSSTYLNIIMSVSEELIFLQNRTCDDNV